MRKFLFLIVLLLAPCFAGGSFAADKNLVAQNLSPGEKLKQDLLKVLQTINREDRKLKKRIEEISIQRNKIIAKMADIDAGNIPDVSDIQFELPPSLLEKPKKVETTPEKESKKELEEKPKTEIPKSKYISKTRSRYGVQRLKKSRTNRILMNKLSRKRRSYNKKARTKKEIKRTANASKLRDLLKGMKDTRKRK